MRARLNRNEETEWQAEQKRKNDPGAQTGGAKQGSYGDMMKLMQGD